MDDDERPPGYLGEVLQALEDEGDVEVRSGYNALGEYETKVIGKRPSSGFTSLMLRILISAAPKGMRLQYRSVDDPKLEAALAKLQNAVTKRLETFEDVVEIIIRAEKRGPKYKLSDDSKAAAQAVLDKIKAAGGAGDPPVLEWLFNSLVGGDISVIGPLWDEGLEDYAASRLFWLPVATKSEIHKLAKVVSAKRTIAVWEKGAWDALEKATRSGYR